MGLASMVSLISLPWWPGGSQGYEGARRHNKGTLEVMVRQVVQRDTSWEFFLPAALDDIPALPAALPAAFCRHTCGATSMLALGSTYGLRHMELKVAPQELE
jgi:hypothetical protein